VTKNEKRNELRHALPALAKRVFALRDTTYPGCGFHWSMEKAIGVLLRRVNDFDSPFNDDALMVCEVAYEQLLEDVAKAEAEAKSKPATVSTRHALAEILRHPEAKVCKHWVVLQLLNQMPENLAGAPPPEFVELVTAINCYDDERAIELLTR